MTVCRGLIKNGERQDEESVGGRRRTEALRQLCHMNPSQALNIRAMVVSSTVTEMKWHFSFITLSLSSVATWDLFYESIRVISLKSQKCSRRNCPCPLAQLSGSS